MMTFEWCCGRWDANLMRTSNGKCSPWCWLSSLAVLPWIQIYEFSMQWSKLAAEERHQKIFVLFSRKIFVLMTRKIFLLSSRKIFPYSPEIYLFYPPERYLFYSPLSVISRVPLCMPWMPSTHLVHLLLPIKVLNISSLCSLDKNHQHHN